MMCRTSAFYVSIDHCLFTNPTRSYEQTGTLSVKLLDVPLVVFIVCSFFIGLTLTSEVLPKLKKQMI